MFEAIKSFFSRDASLFTTTEGQARISKKAVYLKTSAVTVLKSKLNDAGVPDKLLNDVEVAYLAYSAAKVQT